MTLAQAPVSIGTCLTSKFAMIIKTTSFFLIKSIKDNQKISMYEGALVYHHEHGRFPLGHFSKKLYNYLHVIS